MHKANPQKKEVICEVGKLRFWDPLLPSFHVFSFLSDAFS